MDQSVKRPKVSVMMPVYNGARYIGDAIKSILTQTYGDFELLVLDDGSTDNTLQVIKSFNDPRIRIIRNDRNIGTVLTRNKGLRECCGEYVAMLDSDDLAYPQRFEKQVNFLNNHLDVGMVGSWVDLINAEGNPLNASWKTDMEAEEVPVFLLFHNCFSFSAVMLRSVAIPRDGFREGYIPSEDYEIWTRIVDSWKSYNLPEILTTYRIHKDSLSKKQSDLQNDVVDKIVRSQLSKLSIQPTEEELRLHRTNDTYRGDDVKGFIIKREKWLLKLIERNNDVQLYDQRIFQRVINKIWLKTCKSNTAQGFWIWKKFWQSTLSSKVQLSDINDIVKFFIKCLLRKDDR